MPRHAGERGAALRLLPWPGLMLPGRIQPLLWPSGPKLLVKYIQTPCHLKDSALHPTNHVQNRQISPIPVLQ